MDYKSFRKILVSYKCEECGQVMCILNTKDYAWKCNKKLLCSYTCMRKYEKKHFKPKLKNTVK